MADAKFFEALQPEPEFLQLLTFVVLTSVLIHRGSHESKDSDERLEKRVNEIACKVDERHRGRPG